MLAVNSILNRISSMVSNDGLASANQGKSGDPLTTAQVIALSIEVPEVQYLLGTRFKKAVRYLCDSQLADGHWERPGDDWHTSITGWCMFAIARAQIDTAETIERGNAWLVARQSTEGGFAQSEAVLMPNSYSTCYACAGLYFAGGNTRTVERGVNWLARQQSAAGGFNDSYAVQSTDEPSLTAYVAHALGAIGWSATEDIISKCRSFISTVQRPTGAWSAWYEDTDSIEGTAACLRVLATDAEKFRPQIMAGVSYLKDALEKNNVEDWIVLSLAYLIPGVLRNGFLG
jgi:hypothetical protein